MFCKNCGTSLDADAAFCVNCGTPTNAVPPAAPTTPYTPYQVPPQAPQNAPADYQQPPVYTAAPVYNPNPGYAPAPGYAATPVKAPMDPAKKKKMTTIGCICGAVAILAIVLILVFGGSGGFSSATDAAEAFITAYGNRDIEGILNCVPDFMIRELAVEAGLDEDAPRSDIIKMAKAMGVIKENNTKILSSRIEERGKPEEYSRLNNSYYDYLYPEDRAKITEVAIVEVTFMYDGDEEEAEVVCIKMDGRWYAIDMD